MASSAVPDIGGVKVKVIGIYGVSGVGKSYLLTKLEEQLRDEGFLFFEGSTELANLTKGGLEAFQRLEEPKRVDLRERAISGIRDKCAAEAKVGVVAGHFMLWSDELKEPVSVCTDHDLKVFTHVIYLAVGAEVIEQRRGGDAEKQRNHLSIESLHAWQNAEKSKLRDACYRNDILFMAVGTSDTKADYVADLLRSFQQHTEMHNLLRVEARLREMMELKSNKTMLVLDADRTLSAANTGKIFWRRALEGLATESPLKAIFGSKLQYSYLAFRQAALLYQEHYTAETFAPACEKVANEVVMYPQMKMLLRRALDEQDSGAVVVTCGLQLVWEKILERHGFKDVAVIGAGRLHDTVVDARVKAAVVDLLRESFNVRVTAFGDSIVDLEMLSRADRAIVVVGDDQARSKRMDDELSLHIYEGTLKAEQVVMVEGAEPRLPHDLQMLPRLSLTDPGFLNDIFGDRSPPMKMQVFHATNRNAAKLLMTPTRNASISGPILRKAHQAVGWYLATELLPGALGIEEYSIPHVQGHLTSGHRIKDEGSTLVSMPLVSTLCGHICASVRCKVASPELSVSGPARRSLLTFSFS